jgi:antitoxin PrlF
MPYKADATLTSKGQITLPAELRRRWGLKAGDTIAFTWESAERVVMTPRVRRSIFDSRKELSPLSLGRPLRQADIDRAVAEAISAQEGRVRKRRKR